MNSSAFALKAPPKNNALFIPSNGIVNGNNGNTIVSISTDKLQHYYNHPFKLYEGERLDDMVESIKVNGVLMPLLVRPLENGIYEVLAGHNRLESGKLAGLVEMPCIIKKGLTDEEAHLIVTESNLVQRSFADLSHSECAEALTNHYNAIKHQGKRTDLIRQVEALLNGESIEENPDASTGSTNAPAGNKSIEVTGAKYGLSKNSVARYIRVNTLITGFKDMLDSEELAIRAGVSLSFINEERQNLLFNQLTIFGEGTTISMKQAERLRKLHNEINPANDPDDEAFLHGCADILLGKLPQENTLPKKTINFKLDRSAVSSYFKEDDTEEIMQETVLTALQFYHQYRDKLS